MKSNNNATDSAHAKDLVKGEGPMRVSSITEIEKTEPTLASPKHKGKKSKQAKLWINNKKSVCKKSKANKVEFERANERKDTELPGSLASITEREKTKSTRDKPGVRAANSSRVNCLVKKAKPG